MIDLSHVRVMVLDDEPFMLKLLARILGNLGLHQVTLCDSGQAALAALDAQEMVSDLILCDLNMPTMDGVQFVRQLVDRQYQGGLILVSGEDDRLLQTVEKLVRAHRITLLGSLGKPVSPDALATLISQWIQLQPAHLPKAAKTYHAEDLALAINDSKLVNHYQPKVAVATGQVVGVETLVRWEHSDDGLVYPDRFIRLAEKHGLIDELTRNVLANAFRQTKSWRRAGLGFRVAVNVSMDCLASLDFPDFVMDLASTVGIAPADIVLEITESRQISDIRFVLDSLARLSLMRFGLSIDDFGTGYSTLAQLRDIPFDELKIDQSFVHRAWTNKTLRALYDTSLGLAKQLDIDAVAEGVEDRQDWDFLRHTGCKLAQGYFISRPMHFDELPGWLEEWQERVPDLLSTRL